MPYDYNTDTILRPKSRSRRWYRQWWGIFIIIVFTFFFIIFLGFGAYVVNIVVKLNKGLITPAEFLGGAFSQQIDTGVSNQITEKNTVRPFIGAQQPEVDIIEYIDYQCPDCKQANEIVKQLLSNKKYTNTVRFSIRHFPIVNLHSNALKAAVAAECAMEQGAFEEMHLKLLFDQDKLSVSYLKLYSVQLGLDSIAFSICLDSNKYVDVVQNDFQQAANQGVSVAPTFIIGGVIIEGVPNLGDLQSRIDSLL